MMYLFFFMVSFLSSIAGAICGIGGGVIIKPVLDAAGIMEVGVISFLSGCTVLSMSMVSVFKSLRSKTNTIELKTGTPLAVGAAIGGIAGKEIFQYAYQHFPDSNQVGAVQAGVLLIVTFLTLLYTLNKARVRTCHVTNLFLCAVIGLLLGVMSAFLGIGGGPINLMVLGFFFSMDTKRAAANSLYIILFSQAASLINTLARQTVPDFRIPYLVLMAAGGILGAVAGSKINKRMSEGHVNRLFVGLMIVIIGINIYNIYAFLL